MDWTSILWAVTLAAFIARITWKRVAQAWDEALTAARAKGMAA